MARQVVTLAALAPRGLTRSAAAEFVGLSPTAFDLYRAKGSYPGPTLPGGRYDRLLLELAANKLSGILMESDAITALDVWRASRGAR